MVTENTIKRINELYHKSKGEGLTKEEAEEQIRLRKEYVAAFRNNLKRHIRDNKDTKSRWFYYRCKAKT